MKTAFEIFLSFLWNIYYFIGKHIELKENIKSNIYAHTKKPKNRLNLNRYPKKYQTKKYNFKII